MEFKRDVKVGLFVLLGLVLSGLVVFLIGDERRFFNSSTEFRVEFQDVQGLKKGAPVRMGGVRIGQVRSVRYGGKADDVTVYVALDIVSQDAGRIRTDCRASIVNKGFLGDKMIAISKGVSREAVAAGDLIQSTEPGSLFGRFDRMAGKAESAMEGVGTLAQSLADEQLHQDLRQGMRAIKVLLGQITKGEGYPHRLLTDAEEAERISRTVANVDRTAVELTATLREIRGLVYQVRKGPGFAHDILLGSGPTQQVQQIGRAADELALTLRGIRTGNGFAHDMLFGGENAGGDALSNMTQVTADLRDIVRGVKQGKGTLGALLVDPSVYEDTKRLLGNVQRNSVLRALVRYSIKQDEKKVKVRVGSSP